jgi:hypothetical protein
MILTEDLLLRCVGLAPGTGLVRFVGKPSEFEAASSEDGGFSSGYVWHLSSRYWFLKVTFA